MPKTERKDQNYPKRTCTCRKKTRRDALSHDTDTASRGQKDHPQAVQQLLRWQLYPSRQRRRSSLSANALCFCVLPLLSECSFERSGGRRTGGGVFSSGTKKRCAICGKEFYSAGNRAKYCADCKAGAQRKQQAEYARRRRAAIKENK